MTCAFPIFSMFNTRHFTQTDKRIHQHSHTSGNIFLFCLQIISVTLTHLWAFVIRSIWQLNTIKELYWIIIEEKYTNKDWKCHIQYTNIPNKTEKGVARGLFLYNFRCQNIKRIEIRIICWRKFRFKNVSTFVWVSCEYFTVPRGGQQRIVGNFRKMRRHKGFITLISFEINPINILQVLIENIETF